MRPADDREVHNIAGAGTRQRARELDGNSMDARERDHPMERFDHPQLILLFTPSAEDGTTYIYMYRRTYGVRLDIHNKDRL